MHDTARLLATASIAAAALLAGACDVSVNDGRVSVDVVTGVAEREERRSYAIGPDGQLAIENRNGAVEVGAWDGPGVEITITRRAKARSDEAAEALLDRIEIGEEVAPARVRLVTEAPGDGGVSVGYVVRAPPALSVTVDNEAGAVRITGMTGPVRASLRNGAITGSELSGAVHVSSVNGPVSIELAGVGGEVSLATVNGPVRIAIPTAAKATLSARTVNGRITTSGVTLENLRQESRRELEARLNGGGPPIRLETTNGPIVISAR